MKYQIKYGSLVFEDEQLGRAVMSEANFIRRDYEMLPDTPVNRVKLKMEIERLLWKYEVWVQVTVEHRGPGAIDLIYHYP